MESYVRDLVLLWNYLGGRQNYGPLWDPYHNTAPNRDPIIEALKRRGFINHGSKTLNPK